MRVADLFPAHHRRDEGPVGGGEHDVGNAGQRNAGQQLPQRHDAANKGGRNAQDHQCPDQVRRDHQPAPAEPVPGVAICKECAEASLTLFSTTEGVPAAAPWARMTDDELLAHLPEIAVVASQVGDRLGAWVRTARQRRISWARIGAALGMTRQSAWERFS